MGRGGVRAGERVGSSIRATPARLSFQAVTSPSTRPGPGTSAVTMNVPSLRGLRRTWMSRLLGSWTVYLTVWVTVWPSRLVAATLKL
jgi:hypothetical protein